MFITKAGFITGRNNITEVQQKKATSGLAEALLIELNESEKTICKIFFQSNINSLRENVISTLNLKLGFFGNRGARGRSHDIIKDVQQEYNMFNKKQG